MNKIKAIFSIFKISLRKQLISYRVLIIFLIEFSLCMIVVLPIVRVSSILQIKVNLLEIFIAMNSSSLFYILLLACSLLLVADAPYFDNNETMIIYRCGRKIWLLGKLMYTIVTIALNIFFLFTVVYLLTKKVSYIGNYYSVFFTSSGGSEIDVVQFLNIPEKIIIETAPYYAAFSILILTIMYMFFQTILLFILNLKFSRKIGIMITIFFGILGFVIEHFFGNYSKYFPFNNALFEYHILSESSVLPTIAQSYIYFGIVISLLILMLYYLIQLYSFKVRE